MAQIIYDPRWADFVKSQGPGPAQTADQIAEQKRFDQFFQDVQDPGSSSYHKYLATGEFDNLYPGLAKFKQQGMDWQKRLGELFRQKYGTDPITGTAGPIAKPLAGGAQTQPASPPTATTTSAAQPSYSGSFSPFAPLASPPVSPSPNLDTGLRKMGGTLRPSTRLALRNYQSLFPSGQELYKHPFM